MNGANSTGTHAIAAAYVLLMNWLLEQHMAMPVPPPEVAQAEQLVLGSLLNVVYGFYLRWLNKPPPPHVESGLPLHDDPPAKSPVTTGSQGS